MNAVSHVVLPFIPKSCLLHQPKRNYFCYLSNLTWQLLALQCRKVVWYKIHKGIYGIRPQLWEKFIVRFFHFHLGFLMQRKAIIARHNALDLRLCPQLLWIFLIHKNFIISRKNNSLSNHIKVNHIHKSENNPIIEKSFVIQNQWGFFF